MNIREKIGRETKSIINREWESERALQRTHQSKTESPAYKIYRTLNEDAAVKNIFEMKKIMWEYIKNTEK